jgi:hypothetical protein
MTYHFGADAGLSKVRTTVPGKVPNTYCAFYFRRFHFMEESGWTGLSITDLIKYTGLASCCRSLQKYGFTLENQVELLLE